MPRANSSGDQTPAALRPYIFHGVHLYGESGVDQSVGDCPFCGREGKFHINVETGQWDCKQCFEKGNVYTFLRLLWEKSRLHHADYVTLAADRKLLFPETLQEWGLCRHVLTSEWCAPGWGISRTTHIPRVVQLYLWRRDQLSNRMRWICSTLSSRGDDGGETKTTHALFGLHAWNPDKTEVHIYEGMWDGMAASEILPRMKKLGPTYSTTGSEASSLYANVNVVAVPSCNGFAEAWIHLCKDRKVSFFYDNDHERTNEKTGQTVPPTGFVGTQQAVGVLGSTSEKPREVYYLNWGENGYDPRLPHRYDVRDHLAAAGTQVPESIKHRVVYMGQLLGKLTPVPNEWIAGGKKGKKGSLDIECLKCESWPDLVAQWADVMKWSDGLEGALAVQLACAASTEVQEDQIWMMCISPPSTGKSELAEALALDKDHVVAITVMKGLHSGYRSPGGGDEDCSLLARLLGKTLIIKEGDALAKLENKATVMSEIRDIYDRSSRSHYRNSVQHEYENANVTIIVCGTPPFRDEMDSSDLGQRFLSYTIMEEVDEVVEREINRHKRRKMLRLFKIDPLVNGKGPVASDKMKARQMTGGYLKYLRKNIGKKLRDIEMSDKAGDFCEDCGVFISRFRARPSLTKTGTPKGRATVELSSRLNGQLIKLACCLAVVLQKKAVDSEVLNRIRQVTMSTSQGPSLEIGKILYAAGEDGMDSASVYKRMWDGEKEVRQMLQFMRRIKLVEDFEKRGQKGYMTSKMAWRLTKSTSELWYRVLEAPLLEAPLLETPL